MQTYVPRIPRVQPADERGSQAANRHAATAAAAAAQMAMGETLNRSARVRSQLRLQRMLNQRPAVVAQTKLAETLSGRAIQREAMPDEEELAQAKLEPAQRQGDSDALREEEETLQGKFDPVQRESALDEEEALQGKFDPVQRESALDEEEVLQGKFAPVQRESALDEEEVLQGQFEPVQRRENRTGLPDRLKAGVESLSGVALDDVRVHYNSAEPATLQAAAYAQGTDIHVGPGQERHLPHEAWHTVQQMQGRVQPTMQAKGVAINDDGHLESEADTMGAQALRMADTTRLAQTMRAGTRPRAGAGADVSQRVSANGVVQRIYLWDADPDTDPYWVPHNTPPPGYVYHGEYDDGQHGSDSLYADGYALDVSTFHDREAFLEQRDLRNQAPPLPVEDQER